MGPTGSTQHISYTQEGHTRHRSQEPGVQQEAAGLQAGQPSPSQAYAETSTAQRNS
jgi:hypothetical protein